MREMLHRFGLVEDAKAADGRLVRIFVFDDIFEGQFLQAHGGEGGEFVAGQGPGKLAFGFGRLAAARND